MKRKYIPKYIPNSNEEPRKADKEAIAQAMMTFADEPLNIRSISALTELSYEEVHQLVWRMARATTKWPNIRRVQTGVYVWDSRVRSNSRNHRKVHVSPQNSGKPKTAKPKTVATKVVAVEDKPAPAPAPSAWETVGEVDGKHILKHVDGTLWLASRLAG